MSLAVDFGTETDSRRTYCSTNFCDRAGAEELKSRLKAYWIARGYDIDVTVREGGFHPAVRSVRFDVRSNMRNGLPSNKPLATFANTCISEE